MSLPAEGYVRIWQIVGDRKKGIDPVIPISKATWWAGVASGRFPAGVKFGNSPNSARMWDVREIRALLPEGATV